MKVKLFLDDYRSPSDCAKYMHQRIGPTNLIYLEGGWIIVRSYTEFKEWIAKFGLPDLISFDHDLADAHYHKNMQEGKLNYYTKDFDNDANKTGYHCAEWLAGYCDTWEKRLPEFIVHSMNPVGTENIQRYLENYNRHVGNNRK